MSLRRQMLLAIANNYKWLPYSFEYLYHDLIPATINNKQVKDKTRLFKIEGNSEVVNQLIQNGDFNNGLDNWSFTNATASLSGKILTITASQSDSGGNIYWSGTKPSLVSGHRYLISFKAKSSSGSIGFRRLGGEYYNYTISSSTLTQYTLILTASSSGVFGIFPFGTIASINQGDQMELSIIKMTDLDQRYPFDTPTSLTDKRVQNIINRGSEDFNSGEIKNTSLGGFVSAPYNLLDLTQIEKGKKINTAGGIDNDVNSCYIKIKVVPRRIYTINFSNNSTTSMIVFYDKNGNFIRRAGNVPAQTKTIDLTASENINAEIIGITCWENKDFLDTACLHLASVDLGYKPHLNRLPTEYQEVEYIESTGTQWIDSGVAPTNTIGSMLEAQITQEPTDNFIFGARNETNGRYVIGAERGGNKYYAGYGGSIATFGTLEASDFAKHKFYLNYRNNKYIGFDNNLQVDTIGTLNAFPSDLTIHIFARKSLLNGTTTIVGYPQKVYSCQITDGSTLIRHFIPCFRKSDNEIGLFDLVNQVFYTNNGTGTFLKGANVNSVSDLSFAYQGSGVGTSHDSVEKTATEWVFTKNNFRGKMKDFAWTYGESGGIYFFRSSSIASLVKREQGFKNAMTPKYEVLSEVNGVAGLTKDKTMIIFHSQGDIFLRDDLYNDATIFVSSLTDKDELEYQLATPQVIRIPLKHLAVVDLGTLTGWNRYQFGNIYAFYVSISTLKSYGKTYCNSILSTDKSISNLGNLELTISDKYVYIRDDSCSTTNEFINKYLGQYLFYETQDEVADFDLTMGSEAGGTLNSYDFKWIKNQYVLNGTFDTGSYWSFTNGTKNVADNIMTIATSQNKVEIYQAVQKKVANTWYFYSYYFKVNKSINRAFNTIVQGDRDVLTNVNANQWYKVVNVIKATGSGNMYFDLFFNNETNNETFEVQLKECELIDLTKAQLDDATSISDPRIQRIIKLGYIPTDINGTLTYEETEVLQNVDVKEKAK